MGKDEDCVKGAQIEERVNNVELQSKSWWQNVKSELEKLQDKFEELPDKIVSRMSESIDLKIENRIQQTENRFLRYIVALGIAVILEGGLILFSFFINK